MSADNIDNKEPLTTSFADTLITEGLAAQKRWRFFGYMFEIIAKFVHLAALISAAFGIYSGETWVGFMTVVLQSCGVSATQFSSWCFSEEGRVATSNNKILADCGVSVQFTAPDDAAAEAGDLAAAGQANANNV